MKYFEIEDDENNFIRYYNYGDKVLKRVRDLSDGKLSIYKQHIEESSEFSLKNRYGTNGDLVNTSAVISLQFPEGNYGLYKKYKKCKKDLVKILHSHNPKCNISDINPLINSRVFTLQLIIVTNDEVRADSMLDFLKSPGVFNLLETPFNNVTIDEDTLIPISASLITSPTILYINTEYNKEDNKTILNVGTCGLFDHVGVKKKDGSVLRVRTFPFSDIELPKVNPDLHNIIVCLYDKNYKILNEFSQNAENFISSKFGDNGDVYAKSIEGSVTLDMSKADFNETMQNEFIDAMNKTTGGDTVIIDVYEGNAIIDFQVRYNTDTEDNILNEVVQVLTKENSFRDILSSTSLNSTNPTKTSYKPISKKKTIVNNSKLLNVLLIKDTNKLKFLIIGMFYKILYKIPSSDTFLETTSNVVDLPPGFSDVIEAKLLNPSGDDITSIISFTIDTVKPNITIKGLQDTYITRGSLFIDPGVSVTDNSGETLIPVTIGSVNTSVVGTYTLRYTAKDSSNNISEVQRSVTVIDNPTENTLIGGAVKLNSKSKLESFISISNGGSILAMSIVGDDLKFVLSPDDAEFEIRGGSSAPLVNDTNVKDIILPNCVRIHGEALQRCSNLTKLDCPKVTRIDNYGIDGCNNLTSINLPNLTRAGYSLLMNSKVVDISLPLLTGWYDTTSFKGSSLCTTLDLRSSTVIPGDDIFNDFANGGTATFSYALKDSNSVAIQTLVNKGWTIIYNDSTPPNIVLNEGSSSIVSQNTTFNDPGAVVTDNSGETISYVVVGEVDTSVLGTYTLTYTATDSSNNTASVTRTVKVIPPMYIYKLPGTYNFNSAENTYFNLTNKSEGADYPGDEIDSSKLLSEPGYIITIGYVFRADEALFNANNGKWYAIYHLHADENNIPITGDKLNFYTSNSITDPNSISAAINPKDNSDPVNNVLDTRVTLPSSYLNKDCYVMVKYNDNTKKLSVQASLEKTNNIQTSEVNISMPPTELRRIVIGAYYQDSPLKLFNGTISNILIANGDVSWEEWLEI